MADQIQVRKARPDDVPAMARCHTLSIRKAYGGFFTPEDLAIFNEDDAAARISVQLATADNVLVALVNDEVVGHARWSVVDGENWPYRALVHALFIHPDHQALGAGRHLLAACARGAMEGHEGLLIGVLLDNLLAKAWYERLGARLVEEATFPTGSKSYPSALLAFDDLDGLIRKLGVM